MKLRDSAFRDLVSDWRLLLWSRDYVCEAVATGDRDGQGLFWRLSIIRWRQWRRLNFRRRMEVGE